MSLLIALSLALPTADAASANALIRQLDDPRFEVRQRAEEALRLAGLQVVPLLQAELAEHPPLEVAARLQGIINHYIRPDWQRLDDGVAEAKRTGKPLLVVAVPPSGDDRLAPPVTVDAALVQFLKEHYVVAWQVNALVVRKQLKGNSTRDEELVTYLCLADGKVVRSQAGLPGLDQLANPDGSARKLTLPAESRTEEVNLAQARVETGFVRVNPNPVINVYRRVGKQPDWPVDPGCVEPGCSALHRSVRAQPVISGSETPAKKIRILCRTPRI